jgi:hypothetical protein
MANGRRIGKVPEVLDRAIKGCLGAFLGAPSAGFNPFSRVGVS